MHDISLHSFANVIRSLVLARVKIRITFPWEGVRPLQSRHRVYPVKVWGITMERFTFLTKKICICSPFQRSPVQAPWVARTARDPPSPPPPWPHVWCWSLWWHHLPVTQSGNRVRISKQDAAKLIYMRQSKSRKSPHYTERKLYNSTLISIKALAYTD